MHIPVFITFPLPPFPSCPFIVENQYAHRPPFKMNYCRFVGPGDFWIGYEEDIEGHIACVNSSK